MISLRRHERQSVRCTHRQLTDSKSTWPCRLRARIVDYHRSESICVPVHVLDRLRVAEQLYRRPSSAPERLSRVGRARDVRVLGAES